MNDNLSNIDTTQFIHNKIDSLPEMIPIKVVAGIIGLDVGTVYNLISAAKRGDKRDRECLPKLTRMGSSPRARVYVMKKHLIEFLHELENNC